MGKFEIPEPPKTDRFDNPAEKPKTNVYSSKELMSSMRARVPNPDPDLPPPTVLVKGDEALAHLSRHTKRAKDLLAEARADAERKANAQRLKMDALGHPEHNPIHTDRHH